MLNVTIACPLAMDHPEVNKEFAPVWIDSTGNEYFVASGVIEGEATEDTQADPSRITIITGVDGLSALATMGLTPKAEQ